MKKFMRQIHYHVILALVLGMIFAPLSGMEELSMVAKQTAKQGESMGEMLQRHLAEQNAETATNKVVSQETQLRQAAERNAWRPPLPPKKVKVPTPTKVAEELEVSAVPQATEPKPMSSPEATVAEPEFGSPEWIQRQVPQQPEIQVEDPFLRSKPITETIEPAFGESVENARASAQALAKAQRKGAQAIEEAEARATRQAEAKAAQRAQAARKAKAKAVREAETNAKARAARVAREARANQTAITNAIAVQKDAAARVAELQRSELQGLESLQMKAARQDLAQAEKSLAEARTKFWNSFGQESWSAWASRMSTRVSAWADRMSAKIEAFFKNLRKSKLSPKTVEIVNAAEQAELKEVSAATEDFAAVLQEIEASRNLKAAQAKALASPGDESLRAAVTSSEAEVQAATQKAKSAQQAHNQLKKSASATRSKLEQALEVEGEESSLPAWEQLKKTKAASAQRLQDSIAKMQAEAEAAAQQLTPVEGRITID